MIRSFFNAASTIEMSDAALLFLVQSLSFHVMLTTLANIQDVRRKYPTYQLRKHFVTSSAAHRATANTVKSTRNRLCIMKIG